MKNVNQKQFGYEFEIEYIKCTTKCDYMNNDVPINKKKPACYGLDKLENCIIFINTQKLKTRINIELGNESHINICGKDGCKLGFGINDDMNT